MLDYLKRMSWILSVLFLLSACSEGSAGSQGEDPAAVQVELVSEPVSAAVMQKTFLTAQVTGLVKKEGATVQFEIRSPEKDARPRYVETKEVGKGSFTAEQIFDKPGTYSIYIHIYREDLHVTKKKQLVVS